MARTEARLLTEIWDDDDFIALSPMAQRMFMCLLSQSDLAHDGVLALRERRWGRLSAGLTAAEVEKNLAELAETHFVVVDEDTEELLIRSFIRRDKVYRQPNVLRAAADHLALVKSHRIRAALFVELTRVSAEPMVEASAKIVAEMLESLTASLPVHAVGGSGNPSRNPSPGSPGERGVVTAVSSGFPKPRSSESDSPSSETTPPASSAPASARPKRGTRIPDDFAVTPEMVTWATENAPHVDGRRETEKFVNYWRAKSGKDATKLDWGATWRNWMLTAAERLPGSGRASPAAGDGLVEHNGMRLKPETAARMADRARFEALDAAGITPIRPLAIEGRP